MGKSLVLGLETDLGKIFQRGLSSVRGNILGPSNNRPSCHNFEWDNECIFRKSHTVSFSLVPKNTALKHLLSSSRSCNGDMEVFHWHPSGVALVGATANLGQLLLSPEDFL